MFDDGASGFPIATTAPRASVPKNAQAKGGASGSTMSTRSPRRTPRLARSDANARVRCATSSYVYSRRPKRMAVLAPSPSSMRSKR